MPYGMQVDVVEYQRGWFSSTARLEWRPVGALSLPGPGLSEAAAENAYVLVVREFVSSGVMAIDLEIAHGPVFFAVGPGMGLFNARGRIDWKGDLAEAEAQLLADEDNSIDIHVRSFLGGTVAGRLEFQNLNWALGPVSMNLAGGRLAGEWSGSSAFQLRRAALEKMDVNSGMAGAGVRVSLSDIESRTEYPQGLQSGAILYPAESVSSIGALEIAGSGGNTLMSMTGLSSLDSASVGEDGLYRVDGKMEIQSLSLRGKEFAPVELDYESGGFSDAAVLKLVTALNAGMFEAPPGLRAQDEPPQAPLSTPDAAPPGVLPRLNAEVKDALRALLMDGPYAQAGAVATYQGDQSLKMLMRQAFHPDRVPAGVDAASLQGVLSALDYLLDIEMPKAVAQELLGEGPLQAGLAQGLLKQTDAAYSLRLAFGDGGTLKLNEREIPLPLPTAPPPPFEEDEFSPFDQNEPSDF